MNLKNTICSLSEIRNFALDEAKVRAHVMRPENVMNIISHPGLAGVTYRPTFDFSFRFGLYYHLDVNGFGNALDAALQNNVSGYVICLRQHGRTICTRQWNWAKTPIDGSESWTPQISMHIASCSKLITAMALIKALDERQIKDITPIIGFLPSYWVKGPNIDQITFHNLLTHTSGFNTGQSNCDFLFMQDAVSAGVTGVGEYHYQNMNYGLCRILLATIVGDIAPPTTFNIPVIDDSNNAVWDYLTIHSFVRYVQEHVFGPSDVSDATLDHPDTCALAYPFPLDDSNGWNSGNLTTVLGAAGWHMTVEDLLAIMGTFRRGNSVVSPTRAQSMLDLAYGTDVWASTSTPMGFVYVKSGWWQNSDDTKVEQTALCFMPQDMELVAFANSPAGSKHEWIVPYITSAFTANLHFRDVLHHVLRES
jgi:CubicO group peptidase (beta-lactamase class C family)